MQNSLILIVDDFPNWQSLLFEIFSGLNYSCDTASSSQEAMELLSKKVYKLAILDIRLSDEDPNNHGGLDIVTWLVDSKSNTKAIMMTGFATIEYARKAFLSGIVVDFCSKAEGIDRLIESVNKVMNSA